MTVVIPSHPDDQTLQAYGLGKLDVWAPESVNKHLNDCAEYRLRGAEMSSESFLGRRGDYEMRGSRASWTCAVFAIAALTAATSIHAAGESSEEILKGLGLTRAGGLYLLTAESEVQQKFKEAQSMFTRYAAAVTQRIAIEQEAARAHVLEQHLIELDQQIAALNLELEHAPRRPNSVQREYFSGIRSRSDALRQERIATGPEVRRIRSQAPNPKQLRELNDEIEQSRAACLPVFKELRTLVDKTKKDYADLAKNPEVQAALAKLGPTPAVKAKLGPSKDFSSIVAQLSKFEKSVQSPAATPAQTPNGNTQPAKAAKRKKGVKGGS